MHNWSIHWQTVHPGFNVELWNGRVTHAEYRTLSLWSTHREGQLGIDRRTHFLYRGEELRSDGLKPETVRAILDLIANDLGLPPAVVDYIPCEFCSLVPATHNNGEYNVCLQCSKDPRATNKWSPGLKKAGKKK